MNLIRMEGSLKGCEEQHNTK